MVKKHGGQPGNKSAATHGVYSTQATGEVPGELLTPEMVAREIEIVENLATSEGIEREQEQICRVICLMVARLLEFIEQQQGEGMGINEIGVVKETPRFINSAGRELGRLFEMKQKLGKNDALDLPGLLSQPVTDGNDGQNAGN